MCTDFSHNVDKSFRDEFPHVEYYPAKLKNDDKVAENYMNFMVWIPEVGII